MTILDELNRLHKAASVYSFHSNSSEDAEWVRFIEGCQKHLPALIEVARAAEKFADVWRDPDLSREGTAMSRSKLLRALNQLEKLR